MSYPRTDARRRTDVSFRKQSDPDHHKEESALLALPIDMVQDVIVCDMLHQLHVGIMKRLLLCYTGQIKTQTKTGKWDSRAIVQISIFLNNCKMPSDINRAVRGLDTISFWKATEFRTFLHYIAIVIFRDHLDNESYANFLCLFCAITICSNEKYIKDYLDIANVLLLHFIEVYINIFGVDYISCNIHNLCHLTEEVSRFGPLFTFSAYEFESKLFQIKNLLRSGARPLAQVACRMAEINHIFLYENEEISSNYPILHGAVKTIYPELPVGTKFYKMIEIRSGLSLTITKGNKWFLTTTGDIVAMKYAIDINKKIYILGNSVQLKDNFFTEPMHSSRLGIFVSDRVLNIDALYTPAQVKSKFVCIEYEINLKESYVFIPLMHTI